MRSYVEQKANPSIDGKLNLCSREKLEFTAFSFFTTITSAESSSLHDPFTKNDSCFYPAFVALWP